MDEALARIRAMIEEGVDRMKTDAGETPLIAVGGGSFLVPARLAGVSEVLNVPHQAVANPVGAAIAQVSGEVDQIFQDLSRDEAIARDRQRRGGGGPAAGLPARQLAADPRPGRRGNRAVGRRYRRGKSQLAPGGSSGTVWL